MCIRDSTRPSQHQPGRPEGIWASSPQVWAVASHHTCFHGLSVPWRSRHARGGGQKSGRGQH
eukprot:8948853-Alexandrium_andersonii.AAC.1